MRVMNGHAWLIWQRTQESRIIKHVSSTAAAACCQSPRINYSRTRISHQITTTTTSSSRT